MAFLVDALTPDETRYSSFTLVELERRVSTGPGTYTSTFYRYCNAPQDLPYGGPSDPPYPAYATVFLSRNFPNPTIVSDGNLGNVTQLAFDDFDDVLKIISIQYDMLDWTVRIWEMGVDINFDFLWIKLKCKGRTEDKQFDVSQSDVFTLDVGGTGAIVDTSGVREVYGPTCRFVRAFKGDRCGLAAGHPATTCDGQLSTCTSYGNQVRYGGFPDAPTPGTVIGVWGGDTSYSTRMAFYPR